MCHFLKHMCDDAKKLMDSLDNVISSLPCAQDRGVSASKPPPKHKITEIFEIPCSHYGHHSLSEENRRLTEEKEELKKKYDSVLQMSVKTAECNIRLKDDYIELVDTIQVFMEKTTEIHSTFAKKMLMVVIKNYK
jgi:hypothetical protein